MAKLCSSSLGALVLMVFWGSVAIGQAAENTWSPMETIRWSNDAILAVLAEKDPLDAEGEAQIYEVMDQVTDFLRMSRAAIDDLCKAETEKCDEWKGVFSDLLRIRSIKGLGRYRAERFDYLSEEIDGDKAVVNCLAYYKGDELTLDYELERDGDRWVIVNYIMDDVDTARSYHRRFTRLLKKETVEDIIQRLSKRIGELEQGS